MENSSFNLLNYNLFNTLLKLKSFIELKISMTYWPKSPKTYKF